MVPEGQLEDVLRQVFDTRTKDKIMYFRADKSLPFSRVQEAIETARAAGVRVLAAVTEERREESAGIFGRSE
jgi:biopolymer transport protein ExbD